MRHVVRSSPASEVFKSGGLQARLLVYRKTTSFRKLLAERERQRGKILAKRTSCEEKERREEKDTENRGGLGTGAAAGELQGAGDTRGTQRTLLVG